MRHVFLPQSHTDADLVLAGQLMSALDSGELYVALTATGDRAEPTVQAAVRDLGTAERAAPRRSSAGSRFLTLLGGVASLLHGLFGPRQPVKPAPEQRQLEAAR